MEKVKNNLYLLVKKDIEKKIATGVFKAGDKLPTLLEIQRIYHVGRSTAQKAITMLADEGVIISRVREGSFVKPFVREKLVAKTRTELEVKIDELIKESHNLGFDNEELLSIVKERIEKAVL